MKKLICLLFLCFAELASAANWAVLGHNDNSNDYYDKDSVQRESDGTSMIWLMSDFFKAGNYEGKTYRSVMFQIKYICPRRAYTFTNVIYYSGKQGAGKPLSTLSPSEKWGAVPPDTRVDWGYRAACN